MFVAAGPTVDELSEFNGKPAIEPIRAYAGLHSADGIKATAALAAQELQRKGGLDRAVVAVATTTGTGWINEAEASALEYMYNGDTAIVSMQYSFLPSWLSFLVDKENARQAGQALFEAVDALIREMPEAQRPRLVVFGESLGSFGGEAPFLALNNLIARTDGALFSGPTFNNTIWTQLTRDRDKDSPEWLPIFDKGENVRFAARSDNLDRPNDPWGHPRVVYLQHASDPIAWWNPDLLFAEPDWLKEPRGLRRLGAHAVDSDRHLPAGVRGHGGGGGRTGRARPRVRQGRRQCLGSDSRAAGLDPGKDGEAAAAAQQRRKRLDENAFGLQRVVTADDVGGAVQPQVEQGCRGEAGGVALRAQHDPLDVVVHGLRKPGVTGRVAAPLQHIALDHQRRRDIALTVALGLRPDVDQYRATGQRRRHVLRAQSAQPVAGLVEDTVDAAGQRLTSSLRLIGEFGALAAQRVFRCVTS